MNNNPGLNFVTSLGIKLTYFLTAATVSNMFCEMSNPNMNGNLEELKLLESPDIAVQGLSFK